MSNHAGNYVKSERLRQKLRYGDLARLAGWKNVNRGARRIQTLERGEFVDKNAYEKIANALQLDRAKISDLARQDREAFLAEWENWVDQPVPVQIVMRAFAGCYIARTPPDRDWTREELEAYAAEVARENNCDVCLTLSRRHSTWIFDKGETLFRSEASPDRPNSPWMRLRADRHRFLFSFADGKPMIQPK